MGGEGAGEVESALLATGQTAAADAEAGLRFHSGAVQRHGGEQVRDFGVVPGGVGQAKVVGNRPGEQIVVGQYGGDDGRTGVRRSAVAMAAMSVVFPLPDGPVMTRVWLAATPNPISRASRVGVSGSWYPETARP